MALSLRQTFDRQERKALWLAVVPSVTFAAVLSLVPPYLRSIFSPPDRIVSGPLYDGMLSLIAVPAVGFAIFVIVRAAVIRHERSWSMWQVPSGEDEFSLLPLVLLVCGFATYLYGVSAYWLATPRGLIVHSSWLVQPKVYSWVDATHRQISCFSPKGGGKYARFVILLRDGRAIDLADGNQVEFAEHLPQLAMLTHSAEIVDRVGDGRTCPGFILSFLAANHR